MSNQYALSPSGKTPHVGAILEEAAKYTRKKIKPGDISPDALAPVLLAEGRDVIARPMVWGFPNFQNDGPIYSARAETAEDRTTFRKSLEARRCIIPTTGYYEKCEPGRDAPRTLFHLRGTAEVYLAGIYNGYEDNNGKEQFYFALLTTPASNSVEAYNPRMPVVLRRSEFTTWLRGDYESLFNRAGVQLYGTPANA